jgi:hypothetical protein
MKCRLARKRELSCSPIIRGEILGDEPRPICHRAAFQLFHEKPDVEAHWCSQIGLAMSPTFAFGAFGSQARADL